MKNFNTQLLGILGSATKLSSGLLAAMFSKLNPDIKNPKKNNVHSREIVLVTDISLNSFATNKVLQTLIPGFCSPPQITISLLLSQSIKKTSKFAYFQTNLQSTAADLKLKTIMKIVLKRKQFSVLLTSSSNDGMSINEFFYSLKNTNQQPVIKNKKKYMQSEKISIPIAIPLITICSMWAV